MKKEESVADIKLSNSALQSLVFVNLKKYFFGAKLRIKLEIN